MVAAVDVQFVSAPAKTPLIVPFVVAIGSRTHPYQLPSLTRLQVVSETFTQLRIKGAANVWKSKVYCLPNDKAWEKLQFLHAAFQQTLDELVDQLRSLGRYADQLKAAGKQAANPLTETIVIARDPDASYPANMLASDWWVSNVSRHHVARHTAKMIEISTGSPLDVGMRSQQDKFCCRDDSAWEQTEQLHQRVSAAAAAIEAHLDRLGTYDQAQKDGRYAVKLGDTIATRAGIATVTAIEPAGEETIVYANYGGNGVSQPHIAEQIESIHAPHEAPKKAAGNEVGQSNSRSRSRRAGTQNPGAGGDRRSNKQYDAEDVLSVESCSAANTARQSTTVSVEPASVKQWDSLYDPANPQSRLIVLEVDAEGGLGEAQERSYRVKCRNPIKSEGWHELSNLKRWKHKYDPFRWVKLKGKKYPVYVHRIVHSDAEDDINQYSVSAHLDFVEHYLLNETAIDYQYSESPKWIDLDEGDRVAQDAFGGVVPMVGVIESVDPNGGFDCVVRTDQGKAVNIDLRELVPFPIKFTIGQKITVDLNTENAYKDGWADAKMIRHGTILSFRKGGVAGFYPLLRSDDGTEEVAPMECCKPYAGPIELPEVEPVEPPMTAEEVIEEMERAMSGESAAQFKVGDCVQYNLDGELRQGTIHLLLPNAKGASIDEGSPIRRFVPFDDLTPIHPSTHPPIPSPEPSDPPFLTESELQSLIVRNSATATIANILDEMMFGMDGGGDWDNEPIPYRGWQIATESPNSGMLYLSVFNPNDEEWWSFSTQDVFDYQEYDRAVAWAKRLIDWLIPIAESASGQLNLLNAPTIPEYEQPESPLPLTLPIASIRRDGGTQRREGLSEDHVSDLVDAIGRGVNLPPVAIVWDGSSAWLWDGFHRIEAYSRYGVNDEIEVVAVRGTQRDAVLKSASANAAHGLKRTNADKRRSVFLLLNDEEWSKWSDRKIADFCGVSNRFVSNLRGEIKASVNGSQSVSAAASVNGSQFAVGQEVYLHNAPGEIKRLEGDRALIHFVDGLKDWIDLHRLSLTPFKVDRLRSCEACQFCEARDDSYYCQKFSELVEGGRAQTCDKYALPASGVRPRPEQSEQRESVNGSHPAPVIPSLKPKINLLPESRQWFDRVAKLAIDRIARQNQCQLEDARVEAIVNRLLNILIEEIG